MLSLHCRAAWLHLVAADCLSIASTPDPAVLPHPLARFGFVFLIGLLTVVITAEIAVLCTYVQLCSEDYQWW